MCSVNSLFLKIVFLYILKVAVSADLQFVGSRFVAHDDAVLVHLQCADGPHLSDTALDGMLQSACLVVSVAEDEHFLG